MYIIYKHKKQKMKQSDKIFNNSYNSVDYGVEALNKNSVIAVSPMVSDIYEESTTDDISNIISRNSLYEMLMQEFEKSDWFVKYKDTSKKIEKFDITEMYYYFKHILMDKGKYNNIEVFCGIAEFFKFNYKTLYNDIISIEDKSEILTLLEDTYGLKKEFGNTKKLF